MNSNLLAPAKYAKKWSSREQSGSTCNGNWYFRLCFVVTVLFALGGFASEPAAYSYYCAKTHLYYPNTTNCDEGWVAIPVPPPGAAVGTSGNPSALSTANLVEAGGAPPTIKPIVIYPEPEVQMVSRADVRTQPWAASLQIFGHTPNGSFEFDWSATPYLAVGIGIIGWEEKNFNTGYDAYISVIPVFMDIYFSDRAIRGFATLGVDFINASHDEGTRKVFTNSGAAGIVGAGCEFRLSSGMMFRTGGNLIPELDPIFAHYNLIAA